MDAMCAESRLVGAALTALLHLLVLWGLLRVPAGSDTPPRPPELQAASAEQAIAPLAAHVTSEMTAK